MKKIIHHENEMGELAKLFIEQLRPGMVVALNGPLGAGKTSFVRHVFRALGYDAKVKSPTYTLVETYDINGQHYCHFDLYRLHDPHELEFIGFREYIKSENICFIEWPKKAGGVLTKVDYCIEIDIIDDGRVVSW